MKNTEKTAHIVSSLDEIMSITVDILTKFPSDKIYLIGKGTGLLLDKVLPEISHVQDLSNLRILIPSVSADGFSFRMHAAERGAEIRVTSYAVHDLIIEEGLLILTSIHSGVLMDPYVFAVMSTAESGCSESIEYALKLWGLAHPLHFGNTHE